MRLDQECKRGNGLLRAIRILLPTCLLLKCVLEMKDYAYVIFTAYVVVTHWALAHSVLFVFLTGV